METPKLIMLAAILIALSAAGFTLLKGQAASQANSNSSIDARPLLATNGSNSNQGASAQNSTPVAFQNVSADQLVANPSAFVGKSVSLAGPVGKLLLETGTFTILCSCGQTQIPVSYNGTFPSSGRSVAVQGVLRQDASGKFYFDAAGWNYAK